MPLVHNGAFDGCDWLLSNTNRKQVLEVEPTGQCGRITTGNGQNAAKLSPALLRERLLCGCIVGMPLSSVGEAYHFTARCLVLPQ